jgi:CDP-diacylglycerol--glycerol-3-phosphate 3-phosphatidyltransferase
MPTSGKKWRTAYPNRNRPPDEQRQAPRRAAPEVALLTLPNLITLLRLALLPFLLWLTYSQQTQGLLLAWALFNAAAASDWLDGYLARRLRATSRLGALLDPVVDKVVILSLLFVLSDQELLPLWLVLLNMAREFLVTAARHAYSTPQHAVGANWMGKSKFVLQVFVVQLAFAVLVLRALGRAAPWGEGALFWTTLGMTAVSYAFLVNFVRWHGLPSVPNGSR